VYLGGAQVGTTAGTTATVTGIFCWVSPATSGSVTIGVAAVDASGATSAQDTITLATPQCPGGGGGGGSPQPPAAPSGLATSGVTQTGVTLNWTSSTGAASYRVTENGVQTATTTATSYALTGLTCGTSYTFGVAAVDSSGNASSASTVTAATATCPDTTPPTAPASLATSGATATSVGLSWTASTDNVGVAGYRLYVGGTQVGTATTTSYTFTGLTCGTTYTLGVAAVDAAGNLSATATASPSTSACGGAQTANLWVDANGGTCTRSASPAAYADASACGSFNAAYAAAQPGDLVLVKGGTYGAQTIAVDPTKVNASSDVTMEVAAGETATLNGELDIYGSHLVLRGASPANRSLRDPYHIVTVDPVGGAETGSNRTNHVTVQYIAAANFQVGPATYVTLDSNDFGPSIACNANYPSAQTEDQISWDGSYPGVVPDHVTISDNLIHDMNTDNSTSCHTGGLNVQGFNALTITGNKFYRDSIYDIEFDEFTGTQAVSGLVLENNWFGPPVGTNDHANGTSPLYADPAQADVQVKWDGHAASDWLVAFNSFSQGFAPEWDTAPPSYSNFRVLANVGGTIVGAHGWQFCGAYGRTGVTYAYNVVRGFYDGSAPSGSPACGGSGAASLGTTAFSAHEYDFSVLPYVAGSSQNPDFHLAGAPGSTAADNVVVPGTGDYALATDIDGDARPQGVNRDAGSDER
jgi:chitodextrinase